MFNSYWCPSYKTHIMAGHIGRSAYEKGTGVHLTVVVLNIFPKHFVWICQKPILMLELLFVVLDFKSGSIVPVFLPVIVPG